MKQIQEKLKDICSEKINIQDFSEIILTIREHHNTDVSLLTIGCDDEILNILNFFFNITKKYNINNKDNHLFDTLELKNKKQKYDVFYLKGDFITEDIIKYFNLVIPYSKKESIFILDDSNLEIVNDLSEMLKISKHFTHIIDLKNSSIHIKTPNIRMLSYKELSDFTLKSSGFRADDITLKNTMKLLNGITSIEIVENKILLLSYISINDVICKIYNKDKVVIFTTKISLKNGISNWYLPSNKSYLEGFYLELSKYGNIFYKKFFNVKNNIVVNE